MDSELAMLLARVRDFWNAMSAADQKAMLDRPAEGVARAEASWPKPRYAMVNGIKVYESFEDYCND